MPETKTPMTETDKPGSSAKSDPEVIEARKAFDADEVEAEGEKAGRKHGRSFIYLSLEDAEGAARKIDEHERRMTRKSFAQALGHPEGKGRFKQKLAAL